MDCSTASFPVLHYLPEFTQTQISVESVIPSNHFILCWLLLLLPSIFPSIRVFSNELALRIKWPKYWSFNFSTNPSIEYSGLMGELSKWKKQLQTEANTMRTLTDGLKMRYFHIILFLYLSSHGDMLCFCKQGDGNSDIIRWRLQIQEESGSGFMATAKLVLLSIISHKAVTMLHSYEHLPCIMMEFSFWKASKLGADINILHPLQLAFSECGWKIVTKTTILHSQGFSGNMPRGSPWYPAWQWVALPCTSHSFSKTHFLWHLWGRRPCPNSCTSLAPPRVWTWKYLINE